MNVFQLSAMLTSCLVFGIGIASAQSNQDIAYVELSSNTTEKLRAPVEITQVELGSPLQESNGKSQCSIFVGSNACQPLHVYLTSNHTCNGFGVEQESGPQWFEIHNTLNTTVDLQQVWVRSQKDQRMYGTDGPYAIVKLGPNEKCTYAFFPVNEPLSLDQNNVSIDLQYEYGKKNYSISTSSLSDIYNDARTWQFDGNKWIFAEQNTVPIPEFPLATLVLIISIGSLIVFYRIKIKQ